MNGEPTRIVSIKNNPRNLVSIFAFVQAAAVSVPSRKFADDDHVPIRIGFTEKDLIEASKAAKGRWNPDLKLWFIRHGRIKGTMLAKHIVLDALPDR